MTSTLPPPFAGLEPETVWKHFFALTQIPRGSGNEAGARAFVEKWAREHKFEVDTDEVGNVLVRVNASAPGTMVCLQGHLDMVCVADEGVDFDFEKQAIQVRRDGDNLFGTGTTLGADNGIGVAYGMALAEQTQGPLEVLCTIDEEVGLKGAGGLKQGWLRSRVLLNLDSEEEGFVTIACSGGRDLLIDLPWKQGGNVDGRTAYDLKVAGLQGGHSGIDIGLGRINAIQVLARMLDQVLALGGALVEVKGGVKRNAIPPMASARVVLPEAKLPNLQAFADRLCAELRCAADPDLKVTTQPSTVKDPSIVDDACARQLVHLLGGLPHGVQKHSPKDATLPFVSINLALVEDPAGGKIPIVMSARSPAETEIDMLVARVKAVCDEHGAALNAENGYPGWEPDYDSKLLATTKKLHTEVIGQEPKVLEIHAGLECGIIGARYPGMDMISIGPDIHFPHSPREHVSIPSVGRMYAFVQKLVAEIQKNG
ncbi:MAG: beta-Ala-His dipeptidase [Pseudomonadota bacterium]